MRYCASEATADVVAEIPTMSLNIEKRVSRTLANHPASAANINGVTTIGRFT